MARSRSWGRFDFPVYVPVAERARRADAARRKLEKQGRRLSPVVVAARGRAMADTFWGKAWCENLERYSDFASRLPRGRTYARRGAVVDLQAKGGRIEALVQGSELYEISVDVRPIADAAWEAIVRDCAGAIDSIVELLRAQISGAVMQRMSREGTGLFPAPKEITMRCSCPDWATLCKHVAAVLYGFGARLDEAPALLFALRGVSPDDLVASAAKGAALRVPPKAGRVLEATDLGGVFGIELDVGLDPGEAPAPPAALARSPGPPEPLHPRRRGRSVTTPEAPPKSGKRAAEQPSGPGRTTGTKGATSAKGAGGPTKRAPAAPSSAKRASRGATYTVAELRALGIPARTIGQWIDLGGLVATREKGVYRMSQIVAEFLAGRSGRRARAARGR